MISNGIGGAEKRYANLFNYISANSSHEYSIALNERLSQLLSDSSIFIDPSRCVILKNFWHQFNKSENRLFSLWDRFAIRPTANTPYYLYQLQKHINKLGKPDVIHCIRSANLMLPYFKEYKTVASLFSSSVSIKTKRVIQHLSHADTYDVLNPLVAKKYELLGLPREKLIITPCSFIDYSKVPSIDHESKENSIIFSGRLTGIKGVVLFLNAAKIIKTRYGSKHKFIIMGDGPQQSYVTREIKNSNLTNVHYLGFFPEPMDVLQGAKLFCSLQDDSNYPSQSLMEAMACGCAIIATDVGDTRLLVDEDVGILIPPGRPDRLADAICDLLNNPERCSALGKIARERVFSTMRVEKYMDFLEDLYDRL